MFRSFRNRKNRATIKSSDPELEKIFRNIERNLRAATIDLRNRNYLLDTPEIDKLCQNKGREVMDKFSTSSKKTELNKKLNVYISGEIYIHGGHTREIEDWIESSYSDRENIIILSSPVHKSHKEELEKLASKNIRIIYSNQANLVDRIIWLQNILAELSPDVIFVSTTHTDVVVLAALQKEFINKLYWNLSLDSSVSIGLHLEGITKIIVKRPYLYFYLKDLAKLNNLVYIPLNRPDVVGDLKNYVSADLTKKIITASCTSSSYKIEMAYAHKFTSVIPNILKITGGTHIHFGSISELELDILHKNMDDLGLSKEKFVVIKHVSSLAKALIEKDVDILIQTFPVGGGLVSIEAMEAGKMIVNHKNYSSHLLSLADLCYEEAFNWGSPEDLYKYFRYLTREDIIKQSNYSRSFYKKNCNPDALKSASDINNMIGLEVESKRSFVEKSFNYKINFYQKFLDESCLPKIKDKNKPIVDNRRSNENNFLKKLLRLKT